MLDQRPAVTALQRAGLWLLALTITLALGFWLRWTPVDDAMISLTYARTLGEHGVVGATHHNVHYGITSPLNMAMLAVVGKAATYERAIPIATALQLCLLLWASMALARTLFGRPFGGVALALLLGLNPLVLSTLGLESLLGLGLSLAGLDALLRRRWHSAGVWLGLLVLTRPDYAVVSCLAALLFCFSPPKNSSSGRVSYGLRALTTVSSIALIPVAVWHGIAWFQLGSALPVTLFIKASQGSWGRLGFVNGWLFFARNFPLMTALSLAALPLLLLLLRPTVNPTLTAARKTALLGIAHFGALALLGVGPYHWYYPPSLGLLVTAGWMCGVQLAVSNYARKTLNVGLTAVALSGPVAMAMSLGWPPDEAPIHTNWGTHRQYRQISSEIKELLPPATRVRHTGEIGALQFYANDLVLLDPFTDPRWIRDSVLVAGRRSSLPRRLFTEINFLFFDDSVNNVEPNYCLRGHASERGAPASSADHVLGSWTTQTRWRRATWQLFPCSPKGRYGAEDQ